MTANTNNEQPSSFSKSLFLGEIHDELVFPFPLMEKDEDARVRGLVQQAREFGKGYDPRKVEADGWIGDDKIRELGERGLMGLYVSRELGGAGLTQTGYCRVSEEFGRIDATLAVIMGVHQSIGMKGIHLFGSKEQKERLLPDLATGKKLAGFALTEPNAGSDAYNIETWADEKPDGSWVVNGEKRWIGNGNKDVLVTFARSAQGHVAFIIEKGMPGFEFVKRYETMGLHGNNLCHLRYRDMKVPKANLLGRPGEGFKIAVHVLNNGRMSLGTGCVGATKLLLNMVIRHIHERRQFGHKLADFELVQDKIGWLVSQLYGLESMSYLTTGMVDRGVADYSIESAMVKVAATEFIWYAANRVFQLVGGLAYMKDQPYEKLLRDLRIFPIFEGSNDVMRCFIALTGLKPLADELKDLASVELNDPIRSIGVVADYLRGRITRGLRPDAIRMAHARVTALADPVAGQVKGLREASEGMLRKHGKKVQDRQWQQRRLAHAAMDIFAQIATVSRASAEGDKLSSREHHVAETFCTRAARRVEGNFTTIDNNDDARMAVIAPEAYEVGGYEHPLYD
ncbi:MAG: acyl-CoA dehydrogenase family protein [Myxococcota bacterium]